MTTATAPLSPAAGRAYWQESLFAARPLPAAAPDNASPAGSAMPPQSESRAPQDVSHTWVVAAEIQVDPRIASISNFRGSFRATAGQRVDALEVYCKGCRRPYDDVESKPCEEKMDNRHLIGGDQSIRKKRKMPPLPRGVTIVPGGAIQRRGIDAYMAGVSRPR
ncbi:hypothetical protein [Streptomyces sp. bgisy060]|uniref:hypothetical protein n=1 Tax=Streptomyces sp. bgisy060 TaxID=3413775 RepID=UPI003EBA20C3